MKERYLSELACQYKEAKGLSYIDLTDKKVEEAFSNYIKELNDHKNTYIDLIRTLGVSPYTERTVEIGKGPKDTVVDGTSSTIVTPFTGLFEAREGLTYEGDYIAYNGDIYMVQNTKVGQILEPLEIEPGRVYMTHNMYDSFSTENWYTLVRENEVLIGTYGKETDKNKDKKIKKVIDTFAGIGDYTTNYGISDNFYFYAQKSKTMKKEKVKAKVLYEELEYGRVR